MLKWRVLMLRIVKYLKNNKKGAAIIEYAIILSFIAAIGGTFFADDGMGHSISQIINRVEFLLKGEKHNDILAGITGFYKDDCLRGDLSGTDFSNLNYAVNIRGNDGKLIELEDGTYEVIVDRNKLKELIGEEGEAFEKDFAMCFFLYDNSDGNGNANYDTGNRKIASVTTTSSNRDDIKQEHSADKVKFTFTVDSASSTGKYFGMNMLNTTKVAGDDQRYKYDKNNSDSLLTKAGENHSSFVTMNRVK